MYWLSRPPYGRWALAALVVLVAAYMDLSGPAMESYPFVARDVAQGETPEIEWRDVPVGLLPPPGGPVGRATSPIAADTPLVAALMDDSPLAPSDWWAISLDLPSSAVAGADALLSLPEQIVPGIVIAVGLTESFGGPSDGLVAVAPEDAAAVAAAVATGSVIALIRP